MSPPIPDLHTLPRSLISRRKARCPNYKYSLAPKPAAPVDHPDRHRPPRREYESNTILFSLPINSPPQASSVYATEPPPYGTVLLSWFTVQA